MKHMNHYTNVAFAALLISVFILGVFRDETGGFSVLFVAGCWAITKIIGEGLTSLGVIMRKADDDEDQQNQ